MFALWEEGVCTGLSNDQKGTDTVPKFIICDTTSEKGPYGLRRHYAENDIRKK